MIISPIAVGRFMKLVTNSRFSGPVSSIRSVKGTIMIPAVAIPSKNLMAVKIQKFGENGTAKLEISCSIHDDSMDTRLPYL